MTTTSSEYTAALPFIEVPNIQETNYYSVWGGSTIKPEDGSCFVSPPASVIMSMSWDESFGDEFKEAEKLIHDVSVLGDHARNYPYTAVLSGLHNAAYGLREEPDNVTHGLLKDFEARITGRWVEDVRARVESYNEQLGRMSIEPWVLLKFVEDRRSETERPSEEEQQRRWLARLARVDVVLVTSDVDNEQIVPKLLLTVEDTEGQDTPVLPPMHVEGLLLKM